MALYIVEKVHRNVWVVELRGRLTLGSETESLRGKITEGLDKGYTRILIDLAEVTYMDSVGLSTLVSSYTTVRRRDGDLKLLHLTGRLRDLLQITRLSTVFESFDTLDDAVASFPSEHSSHPPVG